MVKPHEPGCTAAVGRSGQVVWSGAAGLADLDRGTPLTKDSVVRIASVIKQFTATALLLLQQQGTLSVDDRLSKHVDDLPRWADQVTLAQLMHMTSGIPEVREVMDKLPVGKQDRISRAEVREVIVGMKRLDFPPGTRWTYSNSNYVPLADVVERRSGRTFDAFLQQTIFGPARLAFRGETSRRDRRDTLSYSYNAVNEPKLVELGVDATGAGALRTTPSELVRWADNYRTFAIGGDFLRQAQFAGAASTTLGQSNPSESEVYGAGIVRLADGRLVHDGGYAGFRTYFTISPDRSTTVAVTCNLSDINIDGLGQALEASGSELIRCMSRWSVVLRRPRVSQHRRRPSSSDRDTTPLQASHQPRNRSQGHLISVDAGPQGIAGKGRPHSSARKDISNTGSSCREGTDEIVRIGGLARLVVHLVSGPSATKDDTAVCGPYWSTAPGPRQRRRLC